MSDRNKKPTPEGEEFQKATHHEELFEEFLEPDETPASKLPGEHKALHESRLPSVGLLNVEEYVADFNERVIGAYRKGVGDTELPADVGVARSIIPPGTGALRDFSYVGLEIPEFISTNCVACMKCVTECPDTAILGKVIPESKLPEYMKEVPEEDKPLIEAHLAKTKKFYELPTKRGLEPGLFAIYVDPTKCKGCGECVTVCREMGYNALIMRPKQEDTIPKYRKVFHFFRRLPDTPREYVTEKALADIMLLGDSLLYVGGAGSCAGCGQATTIRMMLAAMGFKYGKENLALVAATGCNTVYGSTYPFNPYLVPWMNSLFENAATVAMGVRARWNQIGWKDKKLWVLGGDGAMYDIGFQALSRMLASGMDINVLVLDTQVYSNTGGQASTSTFTGQEAKMAAFGKALPGKVEQRKEIARILMMHPEVFVAQTTAYHINHFYQAVLEAAEYPGPAVVIAYNTCQPEHGVADDEAALRAKMAVYSRAFPLLIYNPSKGKTIKERLSLAGNPAVTKDWYVNPRTGEVIDFIAFARGEGRFRKHFDENGNPSEFLKKVNEDRLQNWRLLQELAGIRRAE